VSALARAAVTCGRFLGGEATKAHRSAGTPGPGGGWWSVLGRRTDHNSPLPGRTRAGRRIAPTLAALLLAATACSSDSDDPDRATDPATDPASDHPTIPEPVIVMDVARPELCLGPIAESYPPQCGGPPIRGWRWTDYEGHYDQVGQVRWGEFVVTGTWDGDTFVVTHAEPP